MTTLHPSGSGARPRVLAAGGLLVALAAGAALRWIQPGDVADLHPRPDALEYEESARNLAAGEGFCLIAGEGKYPPRYPFGFPALIVPFLSDEQGSGVRAVLASALASVALTWALGRALGGNLVGFAAAVFLAFSPLHVRCSKSVLSDVPASAAIAGIAAWALAALGRVARAREWFALGACSGLAASIRFTNVLIILPVAAILMWRGPRGARVSCVASLAAGCAAGLVPLFAYNLTHFGSPMANGYSFWAPEIYGSNPTLAWIYAWNGLPDGGSEPNLPFYGRSLAGGGRLYPWWIALLALAGILSAVRTGGTRRAFALLALGFTAALAAFYSLYFYQAERFLLPALPVLLPLAALPLAWGRSQRIRWAAFALVAFGALAARKDILHRLLRPSTYERTSEEVSALRSIDRLVEGRAAVLVHTNVFFFDRILRRGTERVWVPLGSCYHLGQIHTFGLRPYARRPGSGSWIRDTLDEPFDEARADAEVRRLLREGRPVYLSTILASEVPFAGPLQDLLRRRFSLETVPGTGASDLFRVRERN